MIIQNSREKTRTNIICLSALVKELFSHQFLMHYSFITSQLLPVSLMTPLTIINTFCPMNCVGPINSKSLVALKSCAVSLQLLLVIENWSGWVGPVRTWPVHGSYGPGVVRVGSDGSNLNELVQTRLDPLSKFTRVSPVRSTVRIRFRSIFFFKKKENCELFLEAETSLFLFSPIRSESRRDSS